MLKYEVRIVDTIKILGTYVGYNAEPFKNDKMVELMSGLRKLLNLWKIRKLTLFGKILILKTLGISKFIHFFASIIIPKKIVKEIERMFYDLFVE